MQAPGLDIRTAHLSPSLARRLLRYEMDHICTKAGATHAEMGDRLKMARASFTQIMAGKRLPSAPALEVFTLHLNQAARLPRLMALHTAASSKNPEPHALLPGEDLARGIEALATHLHITDTHTIHPLIQAPDYALTQLHNRAALEPSYNPETGLAELANRQRLLLGPTHPATVHYLIDEHCLRRTIGPPEVMAQQYRRLLKLATTDTFTLKVIPATTNRLHPTPTQLLAYDDIAVITEHTTHTVHCTDTPTALAHHITLTAHLHKTALTPDHSTDLITTLLTNYT